MLRFAAILILFLSAQALRAQDAANVYVLHDSVGTTIDQSEKIKYHLFTFWSDSSFDHAEFVMQQDSSIVLIGTMKNGTVQEKKCTKEQMDQYNFLVRYYAGLIPESSASSEAFGKYFGGAVIGFGTAVISYIQTHRGRR